MADGYEAAMEARRDELLAGRGYVVMSDFVDVHRTHQWRRPSIHDFFDRWTAAGVIAPVPRNAWARPSTLPYDQGGQRSS